MSKWFLYALLFFCAHSFAQEQYSILSIPSDLKEGVNSVIINELIERDVTNPQKMTVQQTRVVAVLNEKGNNAVDAYEMYDAGTTIKNVEAYVYNALGKEIEHFKQRDFKDQAIADGNMYTDNRILLLDYTPTTYPYIVVYKSESTSGDTAFLAPWLPINNYYQSTKKSVSILKFDPQNKPRFMSFNIEGYDIKIVESSNTITCTATNLEAIKYENYSAAFKFIAPNIRFALDNFYLKGSQGRGKDWQQFGSWMDKALLQNVSDLPEGTVNKVKNMVANETTNEGKARKIYQYVQDKVRYISVQIGIGGWKPMLASDVDKLSYGDCKALTNYTKALLDIAGIPSYYTIISAGEDEKDITSDFTAMQGNHAILGVPEGDDIIWLECTSQDAPFGYMGTFTSDRDVLIVTKEGGKIVHTKKYPSVENTQTTSATVSILPNGDAAATLQTMSKGLEYGDIYEIGKQKNDIIERYYKNKWGYINGIDIKKIDFDNNREDIYFTENLDLNLPSYANKVNDGLILCPNVFSLTQDIPPRITSRKQDMYIPKGFVHTDTITINIPQNFKIDKLPENAVLESKFGTYNVTFSKIEENKIEYTRKLQIDKGTFPPDDYEKYRDFKRQVARIDKTKILIQPSN